MLKNLNGIGYRCMSTYCLDPFWEIFHLPNGPTGTGQNFENLWSAVDYSLVFELSSNVFLVDINLFGWDWILRTCP